MRHSQVHIDSPCHESWDAMEGDAERRFCGVCQKHVHDLSAMRHDDARALLQRTAGEALCVRYTAEADGTLRFRDLVPRGQLTRKLLRTAFAATVLAACTPHEPQPRDLGDALIEGVGGHAVATPDGGCNYTTGPFTTFHLPPGHALCQSAGPADAPSIVTPPAPMLVSETPQRMGAIAAPEELPQPVVDPVPVPKMGEAIAAPEAEDPFEPCDPQPGYAPPPPPGREEAPRVKMGARVAPRRPARVEDPAATAGKLAVD